MSHIERESRPEAFVGEVPIERDDRALEDDARLIERRYACRRPLIFLAFIAGFLMAFLGSMPPVGPIAVLLLERGVSGKDPEGRGIALGAAFAETIYCALAMAGISELMGRYAIVEIIARAVGVVVLLGLGVYFARFRIQHTDAPAKSARFGGPFALGFSISAANPVLIITWSGSIAALLSFGHLRFSVVERGVFVIGVFSGMLGWFRLFLWMLRRYRERITLRAAQWTVRIAGGAMIALALWGARLFFIARS